MGLDISSYRKLSKLDCVFDADGEPIGFIEKRMISVHNKYVIGIYRPELEAEAVAVFIQLEKMIADRQEHDSSD